MTTTKQEQYKMSDSDFGFDGGDTKCATAAITVKASGKMLPPLFVFKGAKNGRIVKQEFPTFDNSMYYACQENAWMDK